jgi:hypothetical protein
VSDAFREAIGRLDEDAFQALYGPWDPAAPQEVAELLAGSGISWWIAGGRAARAGAPPRRHEDRADLLAARLDPAGRAWLAGTLERLGYDAWARLAGEP